MTFSDNLERLDAILKRLEGERLPLDESLKIFEEGVSLVRKSREFLEKAEQKVTILTGSGEVPFEQGEGKNAG